MPAAVTDDHVYIMRRDVAAADVAVVIVHAVIWTDGGVRHSIHPVVLVEAFGIHKATVVPIM
jgi:hypothetical protein